MHSYFKHKIHFIPCLPNNCLRVSFAIQSKFWAEALLDIRPTDLRIASLALQNAAANYVGVTKTRADMLEKSELRAHYGILRG